MSKNSTTMEGATIASSASTESFIEKMYYELLDETTGLSSVTVVLQTQIDPTRLNLRFRQLFGNDTRIDSLDARSILDGCVFLTPTGAYVSDDRKTLVILYHPAHTQDSLDLINQTDLLASALQRLVTELAVVVDNKYRIERHTMYIVLR